MISTKDYVLFYLKTSDDFLSGEEMSEKIGVSRAAINAAVKALRNDDYQIESVTNKGYRLIVGEEKLSVGEILPYLTVERGKQISVLESTDSTNKYLRNLCDAGKFKIGDCVISNSQTDGRGRRGRHFESVTDKGIYLSYVLDSKDITSNEISEVTAWGAVAVRQAIADVCGISPDIKWVNDLVYENKKICGILTEMSLEGESGIVQYVIMGIGINVNQLEGDFSPETEQIAVSLRSICGHPISRAELSAAIIRNLDTLCHNFPHCRADYLSQYRNHCVTIGKDIFLMQGEEKRWGTALAIDDHFHLSVAFEDGKTESVVSGEVCHRISYTPF